MSRWKALLAPIVLLLTIGCLAPRTASAHALNPSLLSLEEGPAGTVRVLWKVNFSETSPDDLSPVLPGCTEAPDRVTARAGAGVVSGWTARCEGGLAGRTVSVRGLAGATEEVVVRVALNDGRRLSAVLRDADAELVVPSRPAVWPLLRTYVALGVRHILSGFDHLAFVFGLLLLTGAGASLLKAVTGFTVAHSLTLTLATLGVVRMPTAAIEACIALTIVALAAEIARPPDGPSSVALRPWGMPFAFGLLHGFGFAGALSDAGLAAADVPAALFAFNVGVELGQLAFVGAAVAALAALRVLLTRARLDSAAWLRRTGAWALGTAGGFWTVERVLGFWS